MSQLRQQLSATQPLSSRTQAPENVWISTKPYSDETTDPTPRIDLVSNTPWANHMRRHFTFQPRLKQMDWESIYKTDLMSIISMKDFNALESLYPQLAFSDVTVGEISELKPDQIVHLFRLMQLELEYLHGIRTFYLNDRNFDRKPRETSRALTVTPVYPLTVSNQSSITPEQISDVVSRAIQQYMPPPAPVTPGIGSSALVTLVEKTHSDVNTLKDQMAQIAALVASDKTNRDDLVKYEAERLRVSKALEIEERNRRLRVEQEMFNKERLVNLEKERLERARLALELERQQQDHIANKSAAELIDLQRRLCQQLQDHMAYLAKWQPAMAASPMPAALPMPMPVAALPAPQPEAAAPAPMVPPKPAVNVVTDDFKLYISCQDLPKSDWFSLCDPFIVLFTAPKGSVPSFSKQPTPGWAVHSITPVIWDSSHPSWVHPIVIRWNPLDDLALHFQVWDAETKDPITINNYQKQEFIGSCALTLQSVCGREKLGKLWGFKLLSQKEKPLKSGMLQVRATSATAEAEEQERKRKEEEDRQRREDEERRRKEEEERKRIEDEARRLMELDALRKKQEEEEAKRRAKDALLKQLQEKEQQLRDLEKQKNDHTALSQVYAERMNAMVAYQLRTAAKGLSNSTTNSSDPFVVLLSTEMQKGLNGIQAQPQRMVAMTEVQRGKTDPEFLRPLLLSCPSFEDQMLEFQMYQDLTMGNANSNNYDQQFYIGSTTLNLQQLVNNMDVPTTVNFGKAGKATPVSLTVVLKKDEVECENWKNRAASLIREYNLKTEMLQKDVEERQREVDALRKTIADMN